MENPTYIFERTALYYETDQMKIVHHSNYIRWFEEARIAYMNSAGLPYSKMEELGVMIPVLGVDCEYKKPVRFDQKVLIYVKITEFTGVKLVIEYEVRDRETGDLHITGHSKHCFVKADSFRPVRLSKDYPEMAEIFTVKQ